MTFSFGFFRECLSVVGGGVPAVFSGVLLFFQFLVFRFLVLSYFLGPLPSMSASFPLCRLSGSALSLSSYPLGCVGFAALLYALCIGCYPAFFLGLLGLFGLFLAFLPSNDFQFGNFAYCSSTNAGGLYLSILLLG